MRKNLLCIVLTICILSVSNAQIKKGSILLGGDINASTSKNTSLGSGSSNEVKSHSFFLSPVAGKAVKDNVIVGVNLGYGMQKTYDEIRNTTRFRTFAAGIFIRKYRSIGKGGFYVFAQSGIRGSKEETVNESATGPMKNKIKRNVISINAYPGLSYAVSRRFHLETGLSNMLYLAYQNEKLSVEPAGSSPGHKTSSFHLSTSLNNFQSAFYLGFRLLLAKS